MKTGQKEISTRAFLLATFKIWIWCQPTLHQEIKQAAKLGKVVENKKTPTFVTKRLKTGIWWDPLHILNAGNRGSSIGSVRFWFRAFKVRPRPFFHQKTAKMGQKVIIFFLKNWDQIKPWFCDIWIARWRSFASRNIYFFRFRPPSWRKMASKLDKNEKKVQTLGTSYFGKNLSFWKVLESVCYSPWGITVVQISAKSDHIWGS